MPKNPAHNKKNKKVALVLSGGGAKGAYQVGALDVFYQHGYRFQVISGVSVGALNGAMLATDQFPRLQRLWKTISESQVLKSRSLYSIIKQFILYKIGLGKPPRGLNSNEPLKQLLERYLLDEEITTPFHYGFVILESGAYVSATIRGGAHRINDEDILRILASSSIPVQFDPVNFHEKTLVDGGLRNISPIAEVLPFDPDEIVIIPTEPLDQQNEVERVNDILQIAKRSVDVMLEEIFREDIKRFMQINSLVGQAKEQGITLRRPDGSPYKFIEARILAPPRILGDSLDFSRDTLEKRYRIGQERAREILGIELDSTKPITKGD